MPFVLLIGILWVVVCALGFYGRRKEAAIRADERKKIFDLQNKHPHSFNGGTPIVGKDGHDYYAELRHFPSKCDACEQAHWDTEPLPLYRN